MKILALALTLMSTSTFASNCFTRLDSDLGLKLSQEICFNSVLIENGVAYVSVSFDGVEKMKRMVVGKGEQTRAGTVFKLDDIEAIYTSERPECSPALEAHVQAEMLVSSKGLEVTKVTGELVVKGDYCYDQGQVTGFIRYSRQ